MGSDVDEVPLSGVTTSVSLGYISKAVERGGPLGGGLSAAKRGGPLVADRLRTSPTAAELYVAYVAPPETPR